MKLLLGREFDADIREFENFYRQSLAGWWEELYPYLNVLQDDLTWNLMPILVLSAYRYNGLNRQTSVSMAGIFKTVYLANYIHGLVADEDEGQKQNRELQFNILVADYLFGHVLKQLVDCGNYELLDLFSLMIAEINEGFVLEHKLNAGKLQSLAKTRGTLYSTAFLMAAKLAGRDESERQLFKELGYNLGMALELLKDEIMLAEAQHFIIRSESLFHEINQGNKPGSLLERAVVEFHHCFYRPEEAAVI